MSIPSLPIPYRALWSGALVAVLLTAVAIPVAYLLARQHQEQRLQQQLRQAGESLDLAITQMDGALQRLSTWDGQCDLAQLRERRRELTRLPGVIDFFFLDADRRQLCGRADEPQAFVDQDIPDVSGMGHLAAAASPLTGESVFHLYRPLPSGGYVMARLPAHWLQSRTLAISTSLAGGYYGLMDRQQDEPLVLVNWQPKHGISNLLLTSQSDTRYYAEQRGQSWIQSWNLLAAPNLSLVHVVEAARLQQMPWQGWLWLAALFVVSWCVSSTGLWLWWRHAPDPRRLLAAAMKNGEFFNVYQPIRDGRDSCLCGFEVLMRWRSASGIIGPQHFIPMAEETGLLVEMTRRQIEEAIAALQPLIALQPELKVSFNISTDHLKDEQFVQQSALWRQAIPNLVYEITEGNMVAAHDARLLAALHQLRDHGIRLAVDDFGTGYSSLAYLQSLPLDILKADRCFVAALGSDSVNATILEAIIRLAHRLQLDVVAEGVEEARQVAWLNQQGVTLQQGWCHGYPLPIYEGLLLWRKELSTQLMRPSQTCPRSAA